MIRPADRARVLREAAIDLIRASDLNESNQVLTVEIQADRLRRVQTELAEIEQQLRDRVLLLNRYPEATAA